MSKQILLLFNFEEEQVDEIEQIASNYEVIFSLEDAIPENLEIVVGWTDELTSFMEKENANVQWIQYPYAGINRMPLELFEEKGILLSNGSGIHRAAVSETAIGLILGFTRKIIFSSKNQAKEEWLKTDDVFELNGKTMMIVGAGRIGIHLGQIAEGFNMKTIGINRSGRKIENMDEQYVQDDLQEVVHKADIIVNILPATKETYHLFNEDLFSKMKENTIFINVGRGETVDTEAMIEALDKGPLMFAGLDVFEEEPLPKGHPLWSHEKVLITPHIAGNIEHYPSQFYPLFKKNLKSFLEKNQLVENEVELETGY